jgi:16S rRNA (adenine1518-N6/adenine1519-N6)-dimethyltransferase
MRRRRLLGQHFLVDTSVAACEVAYAHIGRDDVVLEVGPGKGILTLLLAQKACQVIAIERDRHLVEELKPLLPDNVMLIEGDALEIDFHVLPRFTKIVSNLPFHISSPLTFKFLEYDFATAVLIYQKDFADRMVAGPGDGGYSRLSVCLSYKASCEILEIVPRHCFQPMPQVDACIVELKPLCRPPFPVAHEPFFFELTALLFSHRRKKIKTTLLDVYGELDEDLPYLGRRVEELTPMQIGELSTLLFTRYGTVFSSSVQNK